MNRTKALMGTVALLTGVITSILSADGVFAAYTTCKTDPVVVLSNGAQLTMIDDISDNAPDIQKASFVLHIPTGVSVTSVTYDSTYGSLESFSWTADQKPGYYRDETTVTTGTTGIQVQATASVAGITCSQPPKWQNGSSGKTIIVPFNC